MKELSLTPLMTISLTLTIGIIIAKWGYDDFNMRFWLIISIISCALSSIIFFLTKFLSKKAYFSRSHQFLIFSPLPESKGVFEYRVIKNLCQRSIEYIFLIVAIFLEHWQQRSLSLEEEQLEIEHLLSVFLG